MPTADEYRSLEMDAAAATSVARGRTALGRFLKVAVPLGALAVAGWLVWGTLSRRTSTMTTPDKEEFTTTQFPAPSLSTPRPQTDQGTIVIPPAPPEQPPPAPPVAPPLALPPPPAPEPPLAAAPPNDDEARRLAELERQRQEEERKRWERLRAPQVIDDNAASAAAAPNGDESGRAAAGADDDPNRRFLASVSSAGVEVARATKNNRIDALVAQGTFIRGVLETAVQSDLPGMVRAVVTENVWSFDGRRVLIPAGSRLIGEYKSGIAQGQTRVFIVWTRMLRSDGVSVQLGSNGADDLGRAGNAGFVDNHYLERFGSAVMLSLVGGAAQFLSAYGQNTNGYGNGTVITSTDPVTGVVTQTQTGVNQNQLSLQAREIAAQNISQTLTNIAQEALRNSINIPPTIYLDQGTRIIVFVRRDLDFSALYPDPVKEALRELKRERAGAKPDGLH
jgi:type IV secretion system protein VirB10